MSNYIEQYEKKTPKSKELFQQADKCMPGGVSHSVRYFAPHPLYIGRADGSRIWDVDGNEYIDMWMGHYALILGHKPKVVVDALKQAVDAGPHWGIVNEHQVGLAKKIIEILPCAEKMRFCVSGTEATMYAVRLARGFTGRNTIIKMEGGWHGGNTDLTKAVKAPFDVPDTIGIPKEMSEYVKAVPYNDIDKTLETIRSCQDDLACIIVEPVLGGGGMIPADKAFLQMLREETARLGVILIFDEVITGFRLALGGAQEYFGIVPDMVTMGKIAGGGGNIGLMAGRADVFALTDPSIPRKKGEGVLTGGGTFSCTPMTMIPGLAQMKYLQENAKEIYPRIRKLGDRLRKGIVNAFDKAGIPGGVVGVESLVGTYMPYEKGFVVKSAGDMTDKTDHKRIDNEFRVRMLNHGVYVVHGGGAVSMAHTEDDIDRVIAAVEAVAKEMAG